MMTYMCTFGLRFSPPYPIVLRDLKEHKAYAAAEAWQPAPVAGSGRRGAR